MNTVYRIENSDEKGPYCGSNEAWRWRSHTRGMKHPGAYDDTFRNKFDSDIHYFGFNSLQQLMRWFTPAEIKRMASMGFHLSIYEISSRYMISSEKQAIFQKKKAKKITSIPL